MFNLANNLTFLRIACIPLLVLLLYFPGRVTCLMAMFIFIFASLTDLADGIIARRYNLVTNLGKFLDPLADKLLVASALIMLVKLGWVEAWVAITILSREILVTGLRAIASDQGVVIAADKYGKLKTILQLVAICPLLLHYRWWNFDPVPPGQVLIYVALVLTLFSGANYLRNFYKKLLTN